MSQLEQILNYVKQINERLNLWSSNAKKTEELPVMSTMNPEGIFVVSELEDGIWKSKQLEIQKIIDGVSLAGQDNKVREVLLGTITNDHAFEYLLDNNGITVAENEIVVLTVLATVDLQTIQRQFLWKKGKGEYNPIGSTLIDEKLLELQPKFISETLATEMTSSPSAIVYNFGTITDEILTVLNTADPARDYTDEDKIYYVRATKDGSNLLYNFVGTNGIYGNGELQMTTNDLVLVYSSSNGTGNSKPVVGDNFISKASQSPRRSYDDLIIDLEEETRIILYACTEINYINHLVPGQAYDGRQLFITNENEDESDIVVNHLFSHVGNFRFPNNADFTLKFKETIQFKLFYDFGGVVTYFYVGVSRNNISDVLGLQAALDSKLDTSAYNQHYKGTFLTEAALNAAHPTANVGDSAQVNEAGGTDVVNYSWDAEENIWVAGGGTGGAANTDALPEGSTNLYFTTARGLATLLTGISFATGGAIVSTDSVLVAFGKLQKQLNDGFTTDNIKSLLGITTLSGDNTGDQDLSGLSLKPIQVTGQTLIMANWTLVSGYYEYNLANANITSTSIVDIVPDNASVPTIKTAEVLPKTLSGSGTVKMYSVKAPTGNIVVTLNIWK